MINESILKGLKISLLTDEGWESFTNLIKAEPNIDELKQLAYNYFAEMAKDPEMNTDFQTLANKFNSYFK